jgi:hypothetical protein
MKKTGLLTLLLALIHSLTFAQYDLGLNYTYARPYHSMGNFIKQAHGASFQALSVIPNTSFAVGAEAGIHGYGNQTTRQTYRFSDGSSTETNVNVGNYFFVFNLVGRMDLLSGKALTPYLMGKVGYNLYWTNLNIEDPQDEDGCKPLENKALLTDGAFSVSGGGGLRWDLSRVIKKASQGRFYADLSMQYTQGGRVKYMNVNIPPEENPQPHQHHTRNSSNDVVSYNSKFINPVNQIVHEHHVGDVYTSLIQSMEFKFGLVFRILP